MQMTDNFFLKLFTTHCICVVEISYYYRIDLQYFYYCFWFEFFGHSTFCPTISENILCFTVVAIAAAAAATVAFHRKSYSRFRLLFNYLIFIMYNFVVTLP